MGERSMTVRRFDEIRRGLSEGRGLRDRPGARLLPASIRSGNR